MITGIVRRWAKYTLILIGIVFIFSLMLVTAALMVFDDDDYRKAAVWGIERYTGYRMIIEGSFAVNLSAEPSLTADRIRFDAVSGGPSPPVKSIGHVNVTIALKPLLLGTVVVKAMHIADVDIEDVDIQPQKKDKFQRTRSRSGIKIPIFESLTLEDIKLTDSSRKMRFQLNRLSIDDVDDTGPLDVMGDGFLNGTDFQIDGQLSAPSDIFDRQQPYALDLDLNFAGLSVSVSGTLADRDDNNRLDLQVAAAGRDLTNLLKMDRMDIPSPVHLKFNAKLSGSLAKPRVSDLNLTISDDGSLEISAQGAITNWRDGTGTDILLSLLCRNEDLLQKIFPEDWKVLTELKFNGALRKVPDGYRIEDITARVLNSRGINLAAEGWLQLGNIREASAMKAVDLKLHLTSPRTESIRPLLTQLIPEIGSVDGRARLTGPVERLALEDIYIVRGGSGPVWVETRGRIGRIPLGADEHVSGMDLSMTIQAEQSSILSTFYGVPIDEIGAVAISGRVTGDTDRFQLNDIEFHSWDSNGLETKLSGGIDFSEQDNGELLGDVRFILEITSPNMGAAEPLLGTHVVPTLGPVSVQGLVLGTTDVLSIEDVAVKAGHPDDVQVKWQGRIGQFPLGGNQPIADVQTFGSLRASRFSNLAALFGIELPDIGPVFASWRETDRDGTYGMDDVKFSAGDIETLKLNASGSIASVIRLDEAFLDGVNLQLRFKSADSHHFFKILGLEFPEVGAIDGRMALTGGQQKLMASNLRLTVRSSKGLEIDAKGGVGDIGVEKDLPLRDIDLWLTARAPGVSALPLQGDRRLPDLGPLEATARVGSRDGSVKVDITKLRAGPQQKPLVQMRATLENIGQPGPMKLASEFQADSRPWIEKFIQRDTAKSPHFAGIFNISVGENRVRVDRFRLSTEEMGGLTILADGLLESGVDPHGLKLHVISNAADPAKWGSLFGLTLPRLSPLTIDGHYAGLKQERIFEGETRLGKTRFETLVRQPVDHPRFQLNARLSSHTVHLEDFGFYPRDGKPKTVVGQPAATPAEAPLFNDQPLPLDFLQSNDFSLNVRADRVVGADVGLGPVNLEVALNQGRLRIATSEMGYRQGQMSLESVLDATGSVPRVGLKILVEDMDVDDTLSYLQKPLLLEGQLNLAVDLQSRGRSSKEMAANLSGEFGVAVENGRIQRGVEMIASDALDLLFTAPAQNAFTDLDCLAGRLDFDKGVGSIQFLYLDTPGVRARGFGSIDLASENVDIVIKPESKRRFFRRSSPVRIQGQLNDPAVKKIPANEAAILAGQLAVPIIALPARALGMLWSVIKEDKDENSPCLIGVLPQTK